MSQLISDINIDPAQKIADAILDRPVALFAGQGSQESGMGRDLAEADTDAMERWREAEKISSLPLREIYWEGDSTAMNDTRALQPALTVVNCNIWDAVMKNHPISPIACAGHSLGEFSALVAAGAISPKSAIEITTLRGRLMADVDPEGKGGMAAIVKLSDEDVRQIVAEVVSASGSVLVAANYNTPEQTVISGERDAVKTACKLAKERKGRSVELKVSGAFHSPMMEEANRQLQPLLEKVEWHDPKIPVFCNVDARPALTREVVKKNILRQMISPVYWVNLIRNLYLAGARWWLEISPRAVLGKMVGPSVAGIAGQCDSLRVDLLNSLTSILNASM